MNSKKLQMNLEAFKVNSEDFNKNKYNTQNSKEFEELKKLLRN